jgi:hypothetical protein
MRCHAEAAGHRRLLSALREPAWMRRPWCVAILRAALSMLAAPRRALARRAIRRSNLFDGAWYLAVNPDVADGGMDPLDHYLRHGAEEGRQPNRCFIPAWYGLQCPHLAALRINPLLHYLRSGAARGLSPHPEVLPSLPMHQAEARDYPTLLHYVLAKGLPDPDRAGDPAPEPPAAPPAPGAAKAVSVECTAGAGRRICVFSHYDREGRILRYVRHYLDALVRHGFEIHFVSAAPRLDAADRAAVEAQGIGVHLRDNLGRDFGSWQWALREIPALDDAGTLLLANDSVFGPLFDLGEVLAAMAAEPADIWGITDSFDVQWHLQSYFLCLSRRAHRGPAFKRVFAQDFASFADKRCVIDQGEIQLSQALVGAGLVARAYCPYERISPARAVEKKFNPMYSFWESLIVEQRCPFLKRELFHNYPDADSRILHWRTVVEGFAAYDSTLIDEYLDHAAGTARGA